GGGPVELNRKTRQMGRHQILEGDGYGGRRQAKDEYRAEVVEGAEKQPEQGVELLAGAAVRQNAPVRQVGQGPVGGGARGTESLGRNQGGGDQGRPQQVNGHDPGRRPQQFARVPNASARMLRGGGGGALGQRHGHHAHLEAAQAQGHGGE